jgi:hypothetical protein
MDETEQARLVALIPGGGWMIYHTSEGEDWSDPVVAWALTAAGDVVPLTVDSDDMRPRPAQEDIRASVWHLASSDARAQRWKEIHESKIKKVQASGAE